MSTFLEYCVTRRCCYVDLRCGIQNQTEGGGEWGDVNVHCSASPEDVVTLIFVVAYRRRGGGWGMLTFLALRHQKMLLRWRCCYVDGFDTLKMLLCWTCRYVEDVLTLKMLLRWRWCYVDGFDTLKMLLHWTCCYVEDVVITLKMLNMLSKRHCGCEEQKASCAFRPWFSGDLWHFNVSPKT